MAKLSKEQKIKSSNVVWQKGKVSLEEREAQNGHKGAILWMTGLSASGKSTIALNLERKLVDHGIHSFILDGDNIRHGLNSDLEFSKEDREENIRRIGEVAKLFQEAGTVVLVSFISPYRSDRDQVRQIVRSGRFIEVFVDCSLKECERRDPKGLYAKARRGEIPDFTGISSPYEPPLAPEIHIQTDVETIENSVNKIFEYLVGPIIDKHGKRHP